MNSNTRATGITRDPVFLEHLTDAGHPERPGRLAAIYRLLDQPEMKDRFHLIPPREADRDDILLVHAPEHYDRLAATAQRDFTALTPDTFASRGSFRAALSAAGSVCRAASLVVDGTLANAFALVRPPGHHAEKSRAMGYCLFNNVAVGARFARERLRLDRVLIVDWDLHHGNGSQHLFEQDPSVLFFSVHQNRLFPQTGDFREIGRGRGEGFTINIPLPKGCGDGEYITLFETILRPAALKFQPDLILVSAGFDAHRDDSMGGMRLTEAGYAGLTRSLLEIAAAVCRGRLVLVLEGGYHDASLAGSVKAVLDELSGQTRADIEALGRQGDPGKLQPLHKKVREVHNRLWGF
ncbi:MAG: histone deacetylase [Pseudomonadota bacterium]